MSKIIDYIDFQMEVKEEDLHGHLYTAARAVHGKFWLGFKELGYVEIEEPTYLKNVVVFSYDQSYLKTRVFKILNSSLFHLNAESFPHVDAELLLLQHLEEALDILNLHVRTNQTVLRPSSIAYGNFTVAPTPKTDVVSAKAECVYFLNDHGKFLNFSLFQVPCYAIHHVRPAPPSAENAL